MMKWLPFLGAMCVILDVGYGMLTAKNVVLRRYHPAFPPQERETGI